MCRRITALILLALLPVASAAVEAPAPLKPPTMVRCNTSSCHHDAQALEAFLVDFYAWYIKSYDGTEKEVIANQRTLKNILTPEFHTWYRSTGEYDGINPSPYCIDPNADPITCQFHPPREWLGAITAKKLAQGDRMAQIVVTLPKWDTVEHPEMNTLNFPSYRLLIQLKIVNNAWRIDGVRSLPDNDR